MAKMIFQKEKKVPKIEYGEALEKNRVLERQNKRFLIYALLGTLLGILGIIF